MATSVSMSYQDENYRHINPGIIVTQPARFPEMRNDTFQKMLADNIDRLAERKLGPAYTDNELACKANIDPDTLRNWIKLDAWPRLDKLKKLADFLGVEPWQLLYPDVDQLNRDLAELARYRAARDEAQISHNRRFSDR